MPTPERSVLGRLWRTTLRNCLRKSRRCMDVPSSFKPWEKATICDGGDCIVQDNGTPEFKINLAHPLWEDAVVHELRHLVLRKMQYPSFSLKNDVGALSSSTT